MTHAHHHCTHTVTYCAKCNVCYCTKCGQEWGRPAWHFTYPYYQTTPYGLTSPLTTGSATWTLGAASTTDATTSGGPCTHAS